MITIYYSLGWCRYKKQNTSTRRQNFVLQEEIFLLRRQSSVEYMLLTT